jgi:signal transduction histidine kinase
MAALGAAASLIAHEVKLAQRAARRGRQEAEGPGACAHHPGQTDRLAHLATSLCTGKPAEPRASPTVQLAREAVDGLRVLPEFDEVKLTTELWDAVPVTCDPLLVATALDNLIRNAVEAGVVAKDLGAVAEPAVRVAAGQVDGHGYVVVEDNAGGPAPDVEARLFEPFVTAKPKGIGLGLAMARRAMEQRAGSLSFERGAQEPLHHPPACGHAANLPPCWSIARPSPPWRRRAQRKDSPSPAHSLHARKAIEVGARGDSRPPTPDGDGLHSSPAGTSRPPSW